MCKITHFYLLKSNLITFFNIWPTNVMCLSYCFVFCTSQNVNFILLSLPFFNLLQQSINIYWASIYVPVVSDITVNITEFYKLWAHESYIPVGNRGRENKQMRYAKVRICDIKKNKTGREELKFYTEWTEKSFLRPQFLSKEPEGG